MGVSKVELSNGETLVDLTEDTVTAETLGEGATAHNSKGEEIVGTMKSGDMLKSVYDTDGDGKVDTANNSEKLGGSPLKEVLAIAYLNSLITSGVLADATCNDDGVIIPKSDQLVATEDGSFAFKNVDYYPMELLQYLINSKKNAVITLNIGKAFVFEEGKQLKLPIKYYDGTIVETVITGPLRAFPSRLEGLTAYTLVLALRGAQLNAEGKFDSIAGWITGIRAEDSVKLDGRTPIDIVFESVASTGTLPRGICDENGVISPDEPWFETDEEFNTQRGEVTPNAYDYVWFIGFTQHIILSVKADIEPVDGKLPLKIKANFFGEEAPNAIIDVSANSPLKADKTYHFIVDSRYVESNRTENGFEVTGLKGAIIGLDPETDDAPIKDSTNLITSGAIYTALSNKADLVDGKVPASQLPDNPSSSTEEVVWLDFDFDLSTMSALNLSLTYQEILDFVEQGKVVKCRGNFGLGVIYGDLVTYNYNAGMMFQLMVQTSLLGGGEKLYYFTLFIQQSNTVRVVPYIVNTTSLGG